MDLSKLYDRTQTGQLLADQLAAQSFAMPGWVIALPRGGVPVGAEIARRLGWPLDIWLVRKLGVPNQPELAMGAIAAPNIQILSQDLIQRLKISSAQIQATVQAEQQELQRRDQCYRGGRSRPNIQGRPVIVVDDGVATGATFQAAIAAIKTFQPLSITAVAPVVAPSSWQTISAKVDASFCIIAPPSLGSISQWYEHFEAVDDATVSQYLEHYRDAE
ncbi:phosphoribosyltransferase [Leptolyngbya iicbica]|uniref:Phosphoribosyltransferase n=2 Tax=Cyanophyceae TaxID=3028117 RepID=A0A4Q7E1S3_9CYAN|nr:phosphoribosyltransferase family protein [Leptolyngbya sp. LK]RZM75061.1 phosphoribosyltransferase [Leptolyngbya sp. LK]